MGLDMYLERFKGKKPDIKPNTVFSYDETVNLRHYDRKYTRLDYVPPVVQYLVKPFSVLVRGTFFEPDLTAIALAYNESSVKVLDEYNDEVYFTDGNNTEIKFSASISELLATHCGRYIKKDIAMVHAAEQVAYWRKANQIRNWFVRYLDDMEVDSNCEYFVVTKDILQQLIDDCQTVLDHPEKAKELMPTSSGCFFGSTDYDEYYFEDLRDTIKQMYDVIIETDWDKDVVVYTDWW